MEIRRYGPKASGWAELNMASGVQPMVWTEVTGFGTSQPQELGPQLGIELSCSNTRPAPMPPSSPRTRMRCCNWQRAPHV